MHTQLLVLGGGPGGYAAAFLAADLGMRVTIVDEQPKLGGVCLLKGCIPSKALLHVAKVISESREMAEWGVGFPEPTIDLGAMRARKQKVIDTLSGGLKNLAKRRNVEIVHARGVFEDSTRMRLEGGDAASSYNCITFEHCIVATGSRPTMPPAFALPTDRVMDSTGALELLDVPKRLLVVGGGYIGLEMGTVYAELGSKVTVVEMTDGLLPGADRDLVKPLHKRLSTKFENLYLGTKVAGMCDKGDAIDVAFEGAGKSSTERFDRVLVAIGRRPNSGGIGLENTRARIDDQGFIVTNDRQCTDDPHLFAIGDVAGQPMLAHKAAHEGKVAVEVLAGEPVVFDKAAIPAVVFTDPEIAWAGLTEELAKREGREVQVAQYPWGASGRATAVGRTDGLTKMIVEPQTERILGVGIVGSGAGELIAEAVVAIEMGCTVRDVAESIHPHPTLSETVGFAGEAFLGTATEIYKPRRRNAVSEST
ncbi:MAG: dihydrolipoyl dehydrogenase [Planctomycetota bacterium]|nr:MAG: dihydrolipoyl dehydrogenase [Planctomycetota bacterium]